MKEINPGLNRIIEIKQVFNSFVILLHPVEALNPQVSCIYSSKLEQLQENVYVCFVPLPHPTKFTYQNSVPQRDSV